MNAELKKLAQKQSTVCRIFANPKRILILWMLIEGEKSVGVIADTLGNSLQNTSQHLTRMRTLNLLQARREAQTIYYSVVPGEIFPCHCLLQAVCNPDSLHDTYGNQIPNHSEVNP